MSQARAQTDSAWPSSTLSTTISSTRKTQARRQVGDTTFSNQGTQISTSAPEILDDSQDDLAEWVETNPAPTSTRRPVVQSTPHQHTRSGPPPSTSSSTLRSSITPLAINKNQIDASLHPAISSDTDLDYLYDLMVSPPSGHEMEHDPFTSHSLPSDNQSHDAFMNPPILPHQITPPERRMSPRKVISLVLYTERVAVLTGFSTSTRRTGRRESLSARIRTEKSRP